MGQPGWERSLGENGYVYMYDNILCCPSKTITALLIVYTPIRNKKLIKNKDDVLSAGLSFSLYILKRVYIA